MNPRISSSSPIIFLNGREDTPEPVKNQGWEVVVERWRQAYNQVRPHSGLGYRPPAPETIEPQPIVCCDSH